MLALYILTAIHALYIFVIGGKHEETRRDEAITRGALSATF